MDNQTYPVTGDYPLIAPVYFKEATYKLNGKSIDFAIYEGKVGMLWGEYLWAIGYSSLSWKTYRKLCGDEGVMVVFGDEIEDYWIPIEILRRLNHKGTASGRQRQLFSFADQLLAELNPKASPPETKPMEAPPSSKQAMPPFKLSLEINEPDLAMKVLRFLAVAAEGETYAAVG